jgi:hypothetical protein
LLIWFGWSELVRNLRIGVGHREHEGLWAHAADHLPGEDVRHREPDEPVCPHEGLGERELRSVLGEHLLLWVEVGAILGDQAFRIEQPDLPSVDAELAVQPGAGHRGGSGAGEHDLLGRQRLPGELGDVEERRSADDRGPVLVIMEDRDVQRLDQPSLDLEALWRLDVLEVDPSEGRRERRDHRDHLFHGAGLELDVEDVDVGKLLEQVRLPLHHRLRREGSDVTEPEHRGAVGHHRHQISACGVAEDIVWVRVDGPARFGDSRSVGQGQVALGAEGLRGYDFDLSRAANFMVGEGITLRIGHETSGPL